MDAEFVLADPAVGLDTAARTVHTASGRALRADAVIAATARGMGLEVTMAGPQPAPMASQIGPSVASLLAELHTERGVRLRLGAGVSHLSGHRGRVTGVCLDTGELLPADVVVVAIGAAPVTEWLTDSGLRADNGLVCDSRTGELSRQEAAQMGCCC
ncbi:FAD-dependent oxidoreductase [Streptosporangium canum]|uniref:FAD-dependent oxidoreductase n=1 Tax=Streptosporangium canum TaxID=324952 RepID=UPI0036931D55